MLGCSGPGFTITSETVRPGRADVPPTGDCEITVPFDLLDVCWVTFPTSKPAFLSARFAFASVLLTTLGISAVPAWAFAVGALVMDLAVLFLPLHDGSSVVSLVLGDGFPFRVEVAYFLTLFAQSVAILIGLMLLRRGQTLPDDV